MNKLFILLSLLFCVSVTNADDVKAPVLLMQQPIGIEQKNREIMSDYKTYFQASRHHMQLKHSLIEQQYSQFLKNKQAL